MTSRAVVLSVDGLAPASLQPYGCSWQPTPNLNRLTAESLVFERCFADSLNPLESIQAMLWGTHTAAASGQGDSTPVPEPLCRRGSTLVTDSAEIAELPQASQFDNKVIVPYEIPLAAHTEIEETALANLFAAGFDAISDRNQRLCWMHVSSLPRCWDVPRDLCYADDEMTLPAETCPPDHSDTSGLEPDQVLAWMTLYGGQVRLLDMLLGILIDAIDASSDGDEIMLIVVGTSGMALGENDRFGFAIDDRRSASLHVPLIVRIPQQDPLRALRICQPWEIHATLDGWLNQNRTGLLDDATPAGWTNSKAPSNWAVAVDADGGVASFHTPSWNLCVTDSDTCLYRKPDDRFDSNDIASRVPGVAEQLSEHAELALTSIRDRTPRHQLSPEVISGEW